MLALGQTETYQYDYVIIYYKYIHYKIIYMTILKLNPDLNIDFLQFLVKQLLTKISRLNTALE